MQIQTKVQCDRCFHTVGRAVELDGNDIDILGEELSFNDNKLVICDNCLQEILTFCLEAELPKGD